MTKHVVSWGIVGCGWISSEFVKDICIDRPDVTDVAHSIAAVGSRDLNKAQKFIDDYCPKGANAQKSVPKALGSYEHVWNDPAVEIVYIGTINPAHYADAREALLAGKHVLVEKPATLNAAQWADLCQVAKKKNLFLMEGFWTKFQPLSLEMKRQIYEKQSIGEVRAVFADFSMAFYNNLPDSHRTLSYEAAGGPLLDLGGYILLPALMALYHNPANQQTMPKITSSMVMSRNNVDLSTCIILDFAKLNARAVLTTSHAHESSAEIRASILGSKGELLIHDGLSHITKISLKCKTLAETTMSEPKFETEVFETPFDGFGLYFEADAVARDLKDGKLQNDLVPHAESALILAIIDEVRKQGGYKLPEEMECLL